MVYQFISLYKTTRSYCCHSDISFGTGKFKFYAKSFYVIGKLLSGELSCMHTGLVCFTDCIVAGSTILGNGW